MAWIKLENGQLMNTALVTHVEFKESGQHQGKAVCFAAGTLMCAESRVAYEFFKPIEHEAVKHQQKAREGVSS